MMIIRVLVMLAVGYVCYVAVAAFGAALVGSQFPIWAPYAAGVGGAIIAYLAFKAFFPEKRGR